MHDPMTVAHEIKAPWKRHYQDGFAYRQTLVTVWHVDPETDGTDDSCDYSGTRRELRPTERLLFDRLQQIDSLIGNDPFYSEHKTEVSDLYSALWTWRHERVSRFRWSAAWHVHHWRVVIEPLADFLRRFERCAGCGRRMGKAVRFGSWSGEKMWHGECSNNAVAPPSLGESVLSVGNER